MVFRRKRNRRRRYRLPSSVGEFDPSGAFPGSGHAGFAASVRQLNASNASLRTDESPDARQRLDMRIRPEAQVVRADTSDWCHSRGLGQDESSAANGAAAEMHEVPLVGESVN